MEAEHTQMAQGLGTIEVRAHRAVRVETWSAMNHGHRQHPYARGPQYEELARGHDFELAEKATKGRALYHGAT